MENDGEKRLWQRQQGESIRAFAAFCVYRDLASERSLTNAVRQYLTTTEPNKRATKAERERRRYATHETPGKYLRNVRRRWGDWSRIHHWVARCAAWDEWRDYTLRKSDLEAEQAAREKQTQDRVQQRALLSTEAVTLRAISRTLAARILEVLQDPTALAQLKVHRSKAVSVVREGTNETRTEIQHPGALELLNLVTQGLEVGGKLYRLAALDQTEGGDKLQPEERARELGTVIAEQLLGADTALLLSLKAELAGLNGKVKIDRNPDS